MMLVKVVRRRHRRLVSILIIASLPGCGPSGPQPVEVTGKVTYNGEPAQAMVTFVPDGGGEIERPAKGETDEAGRFALSTLAANDGAFPGRYRVSVLPAEPPPMPGPDGSFPSWYKSPFPRKYGNPATSDFTAEVKEGAENDFTFALTD